MTIKHSSVEMVGYCKECGWPVIDCINNNGWEDSNSWCWDWYMYCSNKLCKNHEGEGYFQGSIGWLVQEKIND